MPQTTQHTRSKRGQVRCKGWSGPLPLHSVRNAVLLQARPSPEQERPSICLHISARFPSLKKDVTQAAHFITINIAL